MTYEREVWHFMGLEFWADTLVATWITMAILLVVGIMVGRGATAGVPGRLTVAFEMVLEFIKNLIAENADYKKMGALLTYILTLLLFILFSNTIGLFPNFTFGLGGIITKENMVSPTGDLNATLALALLTIILVQIWGIRYNGMHYFSHFLTPHWLFLPLHLIELITKPVTLAFRLYGNIYAKSVLMGVLLKFIPFGLIFILGGFIPHVIWLGFSLFIGAIQAFVFTILTIVYVSQAVNASEH
ncbi:F0F1 ATP synthase subunit A [Heliorestis convoluta]|uniref:ATP synthase subunit a n=1 Tax=Heliorestis convoluta TaxID=356322 RepID=A0A5Q2N1D1_9FIRM|nr:F0F1 ATP synthase subunit A [Heliorestis convoluta]QGG47102.1 ATP synthase F0, A subunit [Heliorestis convoluta]